MVNKLPDWYNEYKLAINEAIEKYLDMYFSKQSVSSPLKDFERVVYYATKGGKRIRAILALETYLSLSGKSFSDISLDDEIFKLCVALEFVHAYSLVHDDLPCMDNDELRRGEPTVWKKFGESDAVLVGDVLNSWCFELTASMSDANVARDITLLIAQSIAFYGMVGGQVEDLYYEKHSSELSVNTLENLHAKKTGKLIQASILGGAILADNTYSQQQLADFGKNLGLAFQIKDDLLDVEGTIKETGKSVGGEQKGFVYLQGIEASRNKLNALIEAAKKGAEILQSENMLFLVNYIASRTK